MSKILLVTPPEQHIEMDAGDRPHLGTLYVASSLLKAGHQVIICDLNHESYYDLNTKIKTFEPEYIGIETLTSYYNWLTEFAVHIKNKFPNIKLIAGGPHASVASKSLVDIFDYIIIGEGEKAAVDIVEGKVNTKIVRYPFEATLDNLPMPARDLLPLDERYGINLYGRRATNMITSRSCPFCCFFCSKEVLGKKFREHSVEYTINEIDIIVNKLKFNGIYFSDDCFSNDRDKTLRLGEGIINNKFDISYMIITRSDKIDPEMLTLLKRSGLVAISYGFEHMDDNVLSLINKSNTSEQNIKAVEMTKEFGLKTKANFILNLPGATKESMYNCLDFAIKYDIDHATFYPLIAYPGTELWDNPDKYNVRLLSNKFEYDMSFVSSNIELPNVSPEEVEIITEDIRNKWKLYKGTKTPWTR